jgi:hypothetical protein
MPSFKDRKPYGYTCFARLFGKGTKPVVYTAVEMVSITRCWADLKANLSPEGYAMKKDHFTINYIHRFKTVKSKPMGGCSEFAIQDETGGFWIPKNELKEAFSKSRIKLGLTNDIIRNEIKVL